MWLQVKADSSMPMETFTRASGLMTRPSIAFASCKRVRRMALASFSTQTAHHTLVSGWRTDLERHSVASADFGEDMKSGQGLETWADGSTFKGEYRHGLSMREERRIGSIQQATVSPWPRSSMTPL